MPCFRFSLECNVNSLDAPTQAGAIACNLCQNDGSAITMSRQGKIDFSMLVLRWSLMGYGIQWTIIMPRNGFCNRVLIGLSTLFNVNTY